MPTMSRAVANLKANLNDLLPPRRLLGLATDLGLRFRERALTPVVTAYLFLRQVLHAAAAALCLLPPPAPGRPRSLPRPGRPRRRRLVARPPPVRPGRLQLLHARHARVAR